MSLSFPTYEKLLDSFVHWAAVRDDIRALLLIGSRARTDHPADEWSDLDLLLVATDPQPYWSTTDWLAQIGPVWLTHIEPTPVGRVMERRVIFAGGRDVDIACVPMTGLQSVLSGELPTEAAVLRRGVRVLVDKENLAARLAPALPQPALPEPPIEADFLNAVNDFWYHTLWTAKHLRRGELWWAKEGCDGRLKRLLRQMLAWHAQATRGADYDTWFGARFLEEWADPRAVQALPEVFAHYDTVDIWQALTATMALFSWLAQETATQWGYAYPQRGAEATAALVQTLMPALDHSPGPIS